MRLYNSLAVAALTFMTAVSQANLTIEDRSFLKDAVDKLQIQIDVLSAAGMRGRAEGLDVAQQSVGVRVSNQTKSLFDILNSNLGRERGYNIAGSFIIQGRFRGTSAPYIVEQQTKDGAYAKVDKAVDAGLAAKKKELYEAAPQMIEDKLRAQVTAAVNSSPSLSMLTEAQKTQLIEAQVTAKYPQVLAGALPAVQAQIDAGIKEARPEQIAKARNEHVDSRLPEIQSETSVQVLDATIGIPVDVFGNQQENPPGMLLFSAGKAHPDIGSEITQTGMSRWENIMGHTSEAERANTVASTGYASVGMAYSISKDLNLMVNFVGYHSRDPWMSAQQYIQRSLVIAREVFNKQQEVYALDTAAVNVRVNAKITPKITGRFWGTLARRFDANPGDKLMGFSFGGTIDLEKTGTTINFSYANSGRAYFNKAYSIGLAQTIVDKKLNDWVPGLILYTDFRGIKHKMDENDHNIQDSESRYVAVGANVKICKFLKKGLAVECNLVGEYQQNVSKSGHQSDIADNDFYLGFVANASYDVKNLFR